MTLNFRNMHYHTYGNILNTEKTQRRLVEMMRLLKFLLFPLICCNFK